MKKCKFRNHDLADNGAGPTPFEIHIGSHRVNAEEIQESLCQARDRTVQADHLRMRSALELVKMSFET